VASEDVVGTTPMLHHHAYLLACVRHSLPFRCPSQSSQAIQQDVTSGQARVGGDC
jgi:hypothetical protein